LYSAKDNTVKCISVESEPIGVDKATQYKDINLNLETGDIIITCTDGLLECLNESGVQYSIDNLSKVIKENCKLSGKDIANKVKDNIKNFCGSTQQYDDQSLLVVKIQG
jgi:sigma-B regulation protein RsbU (phosphoserine phosphatase)